MGRGGGNGFGTLTETSGEMEPELPDESPLQTAQEGVTDEHPCPLHLAPATPQPHTSHCFHTAQTLVPPCRSLPKAAAPPGAHLEGDAHLEDTCLQQVLVKKAAPLSTRSGQQGATATLLSHLHGLLSHLYIPCLTCTAPQGHPEGGNNMVGSPFIVVFTPAPKEGAIVLSPTCTSTALVRTEPSHRSHPGYATARSGSGGWHKHQPNRDLQSPGVGHALPEPGWAEQRQRDLVLELALLPGQAEPCGSRHSGHGAGQHGGILPPSSGGHRAIGIASHRGPWEEQERAHLGWRAPLGATRSSKRCLCPFQGLELQER